MEALFDVTAFSLLLLSIVLCMGFLSVYFHIRRRFSVNVNCWFCNNNLQVPYDEWNSWTCTQCEQYNGFTSEGDYNRDLLQQYHDYLNTAMYCAYNGKYRYLNTSIKLCAPCNRNQQLKIQRLASFAPNNEEDFDQEIEQFSTKLEEYYKICEECDKVVQKIISRTKTLIMTQKFAYVRTNGLNLKNLNICFQGKSSFFIALIRRIISVLSVINLTILITKFEHSESQICHMLQHYLAEYTFIFPFVKTKDDWSQYSIFDSITPIFDIYKSFKSYVDLYLISHLPICDFCIYIKEFLFEYIVLIVITQLVLSFCLMCSHKLNLTSSYFWQTLLWFLSFIMCWQDLQIYLAIDTLKAVDDLKIILSGISLLVSLKSMNSFVPRIIENGPLTTLNCDEMHRVLNKQEDCTNFGRCYTNNKNYSSFKLTQAAYSPTSFSRNTSFQQKNIKTTAQYSKNSEKEFQSYMPTDDYDRNVLEKHFIICNSTANNGKPATLTSSCSVFSKREYNTKVSNIFNPQSIKYKQSIIAPSKLKNSSTWVEQGYWSQSRKHMVNINCGYTQLSRTSSQSSGFESQCSSPYYSVHNSLPPSKGTSVNGDFDNLSVLSEPVYCTNSTFAENSAFRSSEFGMLSKLVSNDIRNGMYDIQTNSTDIFLQKPAKDNYLVNCDIDRSLEKLNLH